MAYSINGSEAIDYPHETNKQNSWIHTSHHSQNSSWVKGLNGKRKTER